ncbi:MAG: group 1 truncated hemoglobin [Methylococcales bacterium]
MIQESLYDRLGGYEGITAIVEEFMSRLKGDSQLGRFWNNRGDDGIARENQLLIDFLCSSAGGSLYYTGRDMKTAHKGMKISESDWSILIGHCAATMNSVQASQRECDEVVAFLSGFKNEIVEV